MFRKVGMWFMMGAALLCTLNALSGKVDWNGVLFAWAAAWFAFDAFQANEEVERLTAATEKFCAAIYEATKDIE